MKKQEHLIVEKSKFMLNIYIMNLHFLNKIAGLLGSFKL